MHINQDLQHLRDQLSCKFQTQQTGGTLTVFRFPDNSRVEKVIDRSAPKKVMHVFNTLNHIDTLASMYFSGRNTTLSKHPPHPLHAGSCIPQILHNPHGHSDHEQAKFNIFGQSVSEPHIVGFNTAFSPCIVQASAACYGRPQRAQCC